MRAPPRDGFELPSEISDVDVDDIGLHWEFVVPYVFEQHRVRVTICSGRRMKYSSSLNSRGSRVDPAAIVVDRALDKVHFERAEIQSRLASVRPAA